MLEIHKAFVTAIFMNSLGRAPDRQTEKTGGHIFALVKTANGLGPSSHHRRIFRCINKKVRGSEMHFAWKVFKMLRALVRPL